MGILGRRTMPARRWARAVGRLALSLRARQDARHELRRRLLGEPRLPNRSVRRVLVLCHGNICRSPVAAMLLAKRLPTLDVRSAGLNAGEGNPPDPTAARCAARLGVSLGEHRSRPVSAELLAWADLILAMQGSHAAAIDRRWPEARSRVRLLGDFLPAPPYLLQDPWGQSEGVFQEVLARLASAVERLSERIETTRRPSGTTSGQ